MIVIQMKEPGKFCSKFMGIFQKLDTSKIFKAIKPMAIYSIVIFFTLIYIVGDTVVFKIVSIIMPFLELIYYK